MGTIDEDFDPKLFDLSGKTVIFDFNILEGLNSCGIREWIKFVSGIKDKRIVYDRCPRLLVDQMNMIKGFLPSGASVRSVYAPFFSPKEEEEIDLLISLEGFNESMLEKQAIRPFHFIGVAVDDVRTAKRVKSFARGKGWTFDVLLDINSELKRAVNVTDVPHVIILSGGKIVYQHTGYIAGEEENLYQAIKSL